MGGQPELTPYHSAGSSNAEFAQVTLSFTMPWFPSKKRSWKNGPGKGKGSGGAPKKKSLTATVTALAKIVKKDHQTIAKHIDYADFRTAPAYLNPIYENFLITTLIDPINWISTCRRSPATDTSVEAVIKNFQVEVNMRHNPLDTSGSTINWTIVVFSGKGDWYPTSAGSSLRKDIDYGQMGAGCPVVLNYDNITVHKRWSCRTKARTVGDSVTDGTVTRSHKMSMNRKLRRTPISSVTSDSNWKKMGVADFNTTEQIYCGVYVDTVEATAWSAIPVFSATAKFTVQML